MVYHIPVKKANWCFPFILRNFLQHFLCLVILVAFLAFSYRPYVGWGVLVGGVIGCLYIWRMARVFSRRLMGGTRSSWHDYFLTLTDAGCMMECPEEGKSSFQPWSTMAKLTLSRGVLTALYQRNKPAKGLDIAFVLNLRALSPEKQKEIVAYCTEHCGKDGGLVAPPSCDGTVLTYTGTPEQAVDIAGYLHRPTAVKYGCFLLVFGVFLTLKLGLYVIFGEPLSIPIVLALALFLYLLIKWAVCPGCKMRWAYTFKSSVEISEHDACYRAEPGNWSRYHIKDIHWKVVRLPHCFSIEEAATKRGRVRRCFGYADAGESLPAFLPTPVAAPGKVGYIIAVTLVPLLGVALVYLGQALDFPSLLPSEPSYIYYRDVILNVPESRQEKFDTYLATLINEGRCPRYQGLEGNDDAPETCVVTAEYEIVARGSKEGGQGEFFVIDVSEAAYRLDSHQLDELESILGLPIRGEAPPARDEK